MHLESETVRQAIERATAGMTVSELAWHPEGKWSTAEILKHLSLSYSGTTRGMRAVLQSGTPKVRLATWKERFRVGIVVELGYFPSGLKAPQQVTPRSAEPEHILSEIHASLSEMDKAIGECEEHFGSKATVVAHLVLGPLALNRWRKFHRIHCLHHMKQIRALRSRMRERERQPASSVRDALP